MRHTSCIQSTSIEQMGPFGRAFHVSVSRATATTHDRWSSSAATQVNNGKYAGMQSFRDHDSRRKLQRRTCIVSWWLEREKIPSLGLQ
jgi:hypothetical protein